jgi:hypothetical protein
MPALARSVTDGRAQKETIPPRCPGHACQGILLQRRKIKNARMGGES